MVSHAYEKSIIGRLFHYYRKQLYEKSADEKYLKKSIVAYKSSAIKKYCDTCTKQCSKKEHIACSDVLVGFEKGKVFKKSCYYIDFPAKIGKIGAIDAQHVRLVNENIERVYHALLDNNVKELADICIELTSISKSMKDYIYFSEIIDLLLAISNYYIYGIFPEDDLIEVIEVIAPYLEEKTKIMAYIIMQYYYALKNTNKEKLNYYLERINQKLPEFTDFSLKYMYNNLTDYDFYSYLTHISIEELNLTQKVMVLQYRGLTTQNIKQYDESKIWFNQSLLIMKNNEHLFTKREFIQSYKRKGAIEYLLGNYNEAYEYFLIVFNYDINLLILDLFLFMDCIDYTDIPTISKKELLSFENYKRITFPNVKKVFNYYQYKENIKNKNDAKNLAEYIVTDLSPIINNSQVAYFKVLMKDLMNLCNETSSYKLFYDFVSQYI